MERVRQGLEAVVNGRLTRPEQLCQIRQLPLDIGRAAIAEADDQGTRPTFDRAGQIRPDVLEQADLVQRFFTAGDLQAPGLSRKPGPGLPVVLK